MAYARCDGFRVAADENHSDVRKGDPIERFDSVVNALERVVQMLGATKMIVRSFFDNRSSFSRMSGPADENV